MTRLLRVEAASVRRQEPAPRSTDGRTGLRASPREPIVRDIVALRREPRAPSTRPSRSASTTQRDDLGDIGVRVRKCRDSELERGLCLESFEAHLPPRVLQLELHSGRADVVGLEVGVEVQLLRLLAPDPRTELLPNRRDHADRADDGEDDHDGPHEVAHGARTVALRPRRVKERGSR